VSSSSVPDSLGRNDPCHCGSGKKYKQCHLAQDEVQQRDARAKAADAVPEPAAEETAGKAAPSAVPRGKGQQPWKRTTQNTRGFQKVAGTRKVGGGG
jgi:SEC-C motif-containing protein